MLIPYQDINPNTLISLIEEFIDREGTDYGELVASRSTMVEQIQQQLINGKIVICYDDESETCNLITSNKASTMGESL